MERRPDSFSWAGYSPLSGFASYMDSIDGMRVFIRALLAFGIKEDEVRIMLHDNPAKLMWLD